MIAKEFVQRSFSQNNRNNIKACLSRALPCKFRRRKINLFDERATTDYIPYVHFLDYGRPFLLMQSYEFTINNLVR